MCIYCGTTKYRKIYENHHGSIPKDSDGRTYEIHHIDGNKKNNNPDNLVALSIQEHYDVHYSQGDYGACLFIARYRLNHSVEEISELARLNALNRVKNGTNPFLGGEIQRKSSKARVKAGTHQFLDSEWQREKANRRVAEGTHPFLDREAQSKRAIARVKNGTCNFLDKAAATARNKRWIREGTHPNQTLVTCPHCGKTGAKPGMAAWHFDKCRNKTS